MDDDSFSKFNFRNFSVEILNLHVDSIEKSIDNKKILKDIYLSCETGEIVGILGRNGSGKSTLLKIIFGTMTAENKFVRVGTKVIKKISDNKNLIHYLPQNHFLPNHIKVKSLIALLCTSENAVILKTNELIINSALLVGFNNVHPFLFYISLVLSFFYLVTLGNFIKCLLFSINSIIILSLLLGGL